MNKFYQKHKKPILFIAGALIVFLLIATIANGTGVYTLN